MQAGLQRCPEDPKSPLVGNTSPGSRYNNLVLRRSKSRKMTWTVGILIVGSLYWSTAEHRERWRGKHLKKGSETPVFVPMRYGRRSRAGTYTMVLAPGSPDGTGKVCESARQISSVSELVDEAKALWVAESPDGSSRNPTEQLAADWGSVGLLPNPESSPPPDLIDDWAKRVAEEISHRTQRPSYDSASYTIKGKYAVSSRGTLQIPWPRQAADGRPLENFNLLLAAATRPTPVPATGDYLHRAQQRGRHLDHHPLGGTHDRVHAMAVAIRQQVYRGILREESAWPKGESDALRRHYRKIFRPADVRVAERMP